MKNRSGGRYGAVLLLMPSAMVGTWLGAHLGIQAIPGEWRTRLTAHDQIESDVEMIVAGMTQSAKMGVCRSKKRVDAST